MAGLFKKTETPEVPVGQFSDIANASRAAAEINYGLADQQMAWAQDQFGRNQPITDKTVQSFMDTMDYNRQEGVYDRERFKNTFQPLENDLVNEARDFASPERKQLEMGRAEAGVAQAFDAARANAERHLESFGIDPSATRYAALDTGLRAQQAAAQAAAGNQAAQQVDATGRALRSEAINVGARYPAFAASDFNTTMQSGAGGVNARLAGTASGASTMGTPVQFGQLGNQALGTSAATLNSMFQNQLGAANFDKNNSSGLGSVIGATLPFFFARGGAVPDPTEAQGPAIPSPAGGPGGAPDYPMPGVGGYPGTPEALGPEIGLELNDVRPPRGDFRPNAPALPPQAAPQAQQAIASAPGFGGALPSPGGAPAPMPVARQAPAPISSTGVTAPQGAIPLPRLTEGPDMRAINALADPMYLRASAPQGQGGGPAWNYGYYPSQGQPDYPQRPRTMALAGGGAIPTQASPSGGAAVDDVSARLNVGEFVMDEDTTRWFGEKFMQNLIQKARKEREQTIQQTGAAPSQGGVI